MFGFGRFSTHGGQTSHGGLYAIISVYDLNVVATGIYPSHIAKLFTNIIQDDHGMLMPSTHYIVMK